MEKVSRTEVFSHCRTTSYLPRVFAVIEAASDTST